MPVASDLPADEWLEAHEIARRRGDSLPELIRSAVRRYIHRYRQ
jgi:hypothetical protein